MDITDHCHGCNECDFGMFYYYSDQCDHRMDVPCRKHLSVFTVERKK
jgi:hypothetical protein